MHPKERMKSKMKTASASTTTIPNPIQTKNLPFDKTDDDDRTADGDDTSITADGDDTPITTNGDDTQQDDTNSITDTDNENTHEDVQMETAVLETDEDQGAPQIKNQGANEE